ncbi:MAG: GNAT family N-acetyltransferase [Candidatus Heimdallarchaeota archaeon]|nr:MAG: GNAT family N-acetyltransferase [Candidatus Heimdallarchaeota archaeon]
MITKANESHIEELLSLINHTNFHAFKNIIPSPYFLDPILSHQKLIEELEIATFYVYWYQDKIVGVIALQIEDKEHGRVKWVYVHPDYQRRGIGRELLMKLELEARIIGIKNLKLRTEENAVWAVNFYTKMGFNMIDRIKTDWAFDVIMEKTLQ